MNSSGKDFLLGLVTGAFIGTTVALLYAPDSGSNTRGKLSYQLSTYTDELKSLIQKLKDEKEKYSSDAKQKGDEVVTDAKKRADDLIKEAESLLDNIEKGKPGR
jgi:gas vesicle protein